MTSTEEPTIHRGLAGVVVDTTTISMVNHETNSLTYRGYPVQELAARCSFEEVAWLLWHGELPSGAELAEFTHLERSLRELPEALVQVLLTLPADCHPMDVCRTAISWLGASAPVTGEADAEQNLSTSVDMYAKLPTIVALWQRHRRGLDPVAPDPDLGYSANFLKMCFGEDPAPEVVRAFEVSMVLYAEHSFNASTFTARVVTSTLSDIHSAVTAAIGALKGPLHGGANEAVMHMLNEIDSPEDAEGWLDTALAEKRKIMGFGHRVYKSGDSRVPTMDACLREFVDGLGESAEHDRMMATYDNLREAMVARKGIHPNLDYPTGPAYDLMGFDIPMFTPLFVMSRITGWTAHIMEQQAANALIRPLSSYVGSEQRSVPQTRA